MGLKNIYLLSFISVFCAQLGMFGTNASLSFAPNSAEEQTAAKQTLRDTVVQVINPGDNTIVTSFIKDDIYAMDWYMLTDTTKRKIGTVTTQILMDNRTLTLISEVTIPTSPISWIDSTIAEAATLRPIHHASYNAQRDMVLDFAPIVRGYYYDRKTSQRTVISDSARGPYFDSNLYPTLIRWLPLREGYRAKIPIYDYNPSAKVGVIDARVKDTHKQTYQTQKSGMREVWIVTVTDGISDHLAITEYFVDTETRKLWRQEMKIGPRKMSMVLVE